ncbi:MAG: TldD/PmbA family protein [Paracoccaceae bacterium]
MADGLENLTGALLDAARRAGADAADTLAIEGTALSVDVRGGRLEQAERAEGIEIGLRVLVGQRQACVSASDTSALTIAALAERAVAMAREAPDDPTLGLADAADLAGQRDASALELCDPAPEPDAEMLQEDARQAEAAALAVAGVTQVQQASAGYGLRRIRLAASNGFSGGYARSTRSHSVVAISGTGTGMERDWHGDSRVFQSDLIAPAEIGRIAGERAVERLGARKPPTGAFPVLFDERVSSTLVSHLLGAINGSAVARGATWLRDAMGESVLPDGMDLTENPHRPRISGSRMFDAEGLATSRRNIVQNGVLQSWTLDLGTARRLGLRSTANAARGVGAAPAPVVSNVALTEGTHSREDLIRDMGRGLLVTSLIGSSINATTGDYSRGAAGFWVEGGQITHPVNECTIAGNLRQMLRGLVAANDARHHLSFVVPSLLVDGLTLAGS